MIVTNFPSARTLYICDIVSVKRVGYKKLNDSYFPEWIDSLRVVEGLDFDKIAPCHGKMGTKGDVRDNRAFYQDLYTAVLRAARADQSPEEAKASIKL